MIGIFFIVVVFLALYVGFAAPSVDLKKLASVFGDRVMSVLGGAAIFFWTWAVFNERRLWPIK
jgi:hypothetical protein